MFRRGRHSEAFTLLESMMAAVILAMSITAILLPFNAGAQAEQEDGRRTLAVHLAEELMEEILSCPFADPQGSSLPGPEIGETTRARFDNVDDYHGYSEMPGEIASFDGQMISDPASLELSRHVTASYVLLPGQSPMDEPSFVRVVVQVRYRNTAVATLTRLAGNFATH